MRLSMRVHVTPTDVMNFSAMRCKRPFMKRMVSGNEYGSRGMRSQRIEVKRLELEFGGFFGDF